MRVGTDRAQLNLKDQREASITIREYASLPTGSVCSVSIGKVDASRCHRNTSQGEPDADIACIGAVADFRYSMLSAIHIQDIENHRAI
jgi:hypothetical protein